MFIEHLLCVLCWALEEPGTGREFLSAVMVSAVYLINNQGRFQVPRMTVIQTFPARASWASDSYRPVGRILDHNQ